MSTTNNPTVDTSNDASDDLSGTGNTLTTPRPENEAEQKLDRLAQAVQRVLGGKMPFDSKLLDECAEFLRSKETNKHLKRVFNDDFFNKADKLANDAFLLKAMYEDREKGKGTA